MRKVQRGGGHGAETEARSGRRGGNPDRAGAVNAGGIGAVIEGEFGTVD